METKAGVCTLRGLKEGPNEDRYRLLGSAVPLVRRLNRGHVYAVMDGASDAPFGMRAAQLVADRLLDFYRDPTLAPSAASLASLLHAANDEAYGWGFIAGTQRSLGAAAATVAWLQPQGHLHVLHVGDTFAALFDGETLTPLTPPRAGRVLERFVGQGPGFRLDCRTIRIREGDLLLLVSDGISGVMDLAAMADALRETGDLDRTARTLADRARTRGSRDDATAVLIEVEEL